MTTAIHQQFKTIFEEQKNHNCEGEDNVCVRLIAMAELPTRFGDFHIIGFYNNKDGKEHVALVKGDIFGKSDVLTRLHSECLTGDGFGSLRCDCRDQLKTSLRAIEKKGAGIVLYLRQEGRGIGLLNKIRAYELQDQGLDTIEANEKLGFKADERDYAIAAHMLWSLKIRSIKLMTNNPLKITDLTKHGVIVTKRVPLMIPANKYNQFYLETKREKAGHLLEQAEETIVKKKT